MYTYVYRVFHSRLSGHDHSVVCVAVICPCGTSRPYGYEQIVESSPIACYSSNKNNIAVGMGVNVLEPQPFQDTTLTLTPSPGTDL